MRKIRQRQVNKHEAQFCLENTDKSAIAEHTLSNTDHRIRFEDTLHRILMPYLIEGQLKYKRIIEINLTCPLVSHTTPIWRLAGIV